MHTDEKMRAGSCLCGKVSFKAKGVLRGVVACHCTQCRKQSGHFYAATNISDDHLSVDDGGFLKCYKSSAEARRGFCSNCGSALFWKHEQDPFTSVLAGSFEKPTELALEKHIYVGDKGDYYEITDGLPQSL